jgi:hypothetical protein
MGIDAFTDMAVNGNKGNSERHAQFLMDNQAFLDSIKDDPHPLRTRKAHAKFVGDWKMHDESYAEMRAQRDKMGFLQFRQSMFMEGFSTSLASFDLLYVLCDDPSIFMVAEDLGDLLRETDLKGADFEMLKLPFRTVYLQLPKNPYKVWLPKEDGVLEGVYITEDHVEGGMNWYVFVCVGRKDNPTDPTDDCLFSMPILFEAGPLEEQVRQRLADLETRPINTGTDRKNLEQFPDVFSWALNCLLYINSEGADLKKSWFHEKAAATMKSAHGGRKRQIRHSLEMTSAEVTWVGRAITIDKEPKEGTPRGPLDGERESPRLHRVRGFWRRQVCGKERSQRKHTWVKPFFRGRGKEIVEKMYKVE